MDKINFQNGILVAKAKVTINGTVYEVEPEEYEGETPLSAEILNEMQNNVEKAINEVDEKMQRTVLYKNINGKQASSGITLSESVDNYDFIEIYCHEDKQKLSAIAVITQKITKPYFYNKKINEIFYPNDFK